mmetsp:Transcript_96572/g.171695  ORF Transcript_96572/g.171695 Transcript_96572/m.171695 type:complete len:205 (+) Transcript_96572:69-683(+)|eukprot:CAMPEP_0197652534 /NCGR_PEP_ID=MMETSP1338-20131121/34510_1 /TAXON_ID=43686 ORGANISM="Pelagodinium beii, Strain RCC1491" /NCGR_SAMPLE_ID=MMETSP1338 /ASSEMBLY_ACC=CAM_ASM_000754 /LENGTH=204 /DNA_ID=CAMNT_0043227433 /DNA_START=69 /DNA_END=683 /DNA_ORIENTATION=+
MDSYSTRGNSIFCTFVTVLGTCAVLNHLTTFLPMERFETKPQATIELNKVHQMTLNTYLNQEESIFSFDLKYDLSTEFHWNMNQLFLYVVASYNDTTTNQRNEVTVWDKIVRNKEDAVFKKKNVLVEYPLRDEKRELKNRKVRLHLRYRTMPITGVMWEKEVARSSFQIPGEYFRDASAATREEAAKKEKKKAAQMGLEDWQYR